MLVADGNNDSAPVDETGMVYLQLLRSLGLPSTVCAIQDSSTAETKRSLGARKRVMEVIKDEVHNVTVAVM